MWTKQTKGGGAGGMKEKEWWKFNHIKITRHSDVELLTRL